MDLRLIGIGIAVTFAIIALSAITLYVAFRIKETFRDEKSTKIQIAKVGFILVILFMAGGMFYFFANAMSQPEKPSNNTKNYEGIKNDTHIENKSLDIFLSYPEIINIDEIYTISFIIYNPTQKNIPDATIKIVGLDLNEINSNFHINSNILYLGNLFPGEKNGYVQLKAPARPMTIEGKLILQSNEINQLARDLKITVLENNKTSLPVKNATPVPSSNVGFPGSQMPPVYIIRIDPTVNPTINPVNPTAVPTLTHTPAPTDTPVLTPVPSPTSTATYTLTPTPTPADTLTSTPTSTPTLTPTDTPILTPTPTPTPTPALTPTDTPTPTPTPADTPTLTPTDTPIPTLTPIPADTPATTPAKSHKGAI